ncbi:hypothetical protein Sjap_017979 [Stephania japonica]|uniref:Raptor N-terminal CASPase-like domain-containing protein n=1 Tax=Stephania japonica TaxID=461633 RepID=A0AAP0I761_9MAGN
MLACWVEDPNGDAFKKHLPRIQDYLWMAEDGMRMQSFGSQSWDTSLGLQALLASGLHEEIWETLKKGHFFVKESQARYKHQLDPTVEEVKKLCLGCRKNAKSERVLFHYNGHGVPKPTANGEIWVFNKSYTQYIPLPVSDLDSWLRTPSIYVFDCSAAGMIVKAFIERQDWSSSRSAGSSIKDCILLAACGAHGTLPQSVEFPADVFTSCLMTPIKMALK